MDVEEEELHSLYLWVDEIPLSRPKRNIARDFADGVLVAELVHHYFPRLVELHNYSGAHGLAQKMYNWCTLNQKVFKRLGFVVAKSECQACASCQPGAIERVLKLVRSRLSRFAEGPGCLLLDSTVGHPDPLFPILLYKSSMLASAKRSGDHVSLKSSPVKTIQAHSNGACSMRASVEDFHDADMGSAAEQHVDLYLQDNSRAGEAPAGPIDDALAEKEVKIKNLTSANEVLETKVRKLEQLVSLKDIKIKTLLAKMNAAGLF